MLAERRANVWKQLEADLDIDEDHEWRAKKHLELAQVELELAAIDFIGGGLDRNG